jgi:oligopeptide transport system substrate-binding protein
LNQTRIGTRTRDSQPNQRSRTGPRVLLVCLAIILPVLTSSFSLGRAQSVGELRLAGPVIGPESLDPALERDPSSLEIMRQLYRGLLYFDAELNPVPELAEGYSVSDDGMTYRFTLREKAAFHSGRRIVADDVIYSLSRSVDPDTSGGNPSQLAGPFYLADVEGYAEVMSGAAENLRGVTAISEREVEIRLSTPRATFPMRLASTAAAIVDRDQIESDDRWSLHPNGSGPFMLEAWDSDVELVLAGFDDYALGAPSVERIVFRLGIRAAQSFNLYQDDEIDLDHVTLYDLDRAADPNGDFADELLRSPQLSVGYIALRSDVEPLDDPNIRRALQLAFPREQLSTSVFNGFLNPALGLIPPGMLDAEWNVLPLTSDLKAASAAISASRYGAAENVPSIRIYTGGALASEVLRAVAEDQLGLTIEVFEMEWYAFLDRLSSNTLPAYELSWLADYPDPEGILLPLWGSGQPDNSVGYSNAEFDALLAEAATEPDSARRVEIYRDAQEIVLADNVVIPTFFNVQYVVRKPWVSDLTITALGILRLETVRIEADA